MADYRFAAQVISRSQGRSVTAAAAYRSASLIADIRTGDVHDYTRKGGVEWTGTMAPDGAPGWVHDREKLWNTVEQKEVRKDAQLAREVQLSLPHELNFHQRQTLICDFVQREFVGRGMVADIAMHKPDRVGDQRNFHAHILLTTREIGPEGFGKKNRNWNGREELIAMRSAWANLQNEHLRRVLGQDAPQVTHLSYADRGEEKVATIHLGPRAMGMERRGRETFLGDHNRNAIRRNQTIRQSRDRVDETEVTVARVSFRTFGYVVNEAKLEARKAIDIKRATEGALENILAKKKTLTANASPKALKALVLGDTRAEVKSLEKKLLAAKRQSYRLRKNARSIDKWVTDPARMIWLKISELHQRDRLETALRSAKMRLTVRLEWLGSADGRRWVALPQNSAVRRELRTEERKLRRNIRSTEKQIAQALGVAEQAECLKNISYGRNNVPSGIDLPVAPVDGRKHVAGMAAQVNAVIQGLPENVRKKLVQELSTNRGQAR